MTRSNPNADLVAATRRFLECQVREPMETETHVVCDVARLAAIIEGR